MVTCIIRRGNEVFLQNFGPLERDHLENSKIDNGMILKSDLEERDFQLLSGVELAKHIRSRDFFVVIHKNNYILRSPEYDSLITRVTFRFSKGVL